MKIGISDFAQKRHFLITEDDVEHIPGYSLWLGDEVSLINMIEFRGWDQRKPGFGRTDLDKVVVVPLEAQYVLGTTVKITDDMTLFAEVTRRQEGEDLYVKVTASEVWNKNGSFTKIKLADKSKFAYAVLYSADALLENDGKRSGDWDWEVVAIIASDVEDEPMMPLALARNYLKKPGGTFCDYTAQQFAEAIYYWSTRVTLQ